MKKIPFPTAVDLALTGKCNLRCKHCNTADTWSLENELSFGEIIGILDQLKAEKVFNINLFGGEPFSYVRILDILEALNDYPMRVTVLTNGTLANGDIARRLKKMKFLEVIQVSIDGSCSRIHDWQRGTGSFDKAIAGARLLIENGLPVKLKAIVNTHNYDDIENMVGLARSMGLGGMDMGDAVECGRAATYAEAIKLNGEMHRRIMEDMFRLKREYPDFAFGGTLSQKMGMLADFYKNGSKNGKRGNFSTCPAGQNMISIRSDGKVVPCSAFWTLVAGDAREKRLADIWENSDVLNEIRSLAKEPLEKYKEECGSCDYMSYCNGGCRAAAYYASGNDLKGIDITNCLVFSGIYDFRVSERTVLAGGREEG